MTLLLTLKTTVKCCARCQQDHEDLEFKELNNPGEIKASHWALCPTNGQPVLLRIEKTRARPSRFRPSLTPAFDRFWAEYPNKKAKPVALQAFEGRDLHNQIEEILAALKWQKISPEWTKERGRFIPHPATYLRGRRWEDMPPEVGTTTKPVVFNAPKSATAAELRGHK